MGLGKTIEAGIILKQYLLDYPNGGMVGIFVPRHLMDQWTDELTHKFGLGGELEGRIRVRSHEQINSVPAQAKLSMMIVDEAHQITTRSDQTETSYSHAAQVAHQAERLLLLSATPVLHNEYGFLRMLHLLDPDVYRLEDETAFRHRIQNREAIGEILSDLRHETNAIFVQNALEELVELMPQDQLVHRQAKQAIDLAYTDIKSSECQQAIHSIADHIAEVYRLHHRMIRHRRDEKVAGVVPGRAGLDTRSVHCPVRRDIDDWIDEWRTQAAIICEAGSADDETLGKMVDRLGIFLSLNPSPLCVWRSVITELGQHAPIWPGEEKLLEELSNMLRLAYDDPGLEQVLQWINNEDFDPNERTILFVSSQAAAIELTKVLKQRLPGQAIEVVLDGMVPTNGVIVCDSQSEEGLNLHTGKPRLLMIDLPFSPNRTEQRLGRLDRYGGRSPVLSTLLEFEGSSYGIAWNQCQNQGFGVFNRSTAALQYVIDQEMKSLGESLLRSGVSALRQHTERLGGPEGVLAKELKRIHDQDQFDALLTQIETDEGDEDTILLDERIDDRIHGPWRRHANASHDWLKCLRFQTKSDPTDDELRYTYTRGTELPVDYLTQHFAAALDQDHPRFRAKQPFTPPMSYQKRKAMRDQRLGLGFVGHPFIDAMDHYLRRDDRGLAAALWRVHPDVSETQCGVRLDLILEADRAPLVEAVKNNPNLSFNALMRRCDELMPPEWFSVWVNQDLEPVTDGELFAQFNERRRLSSTNAASPDLQIRTDQEWRQVIPHLPIEDFADFVADAKTSADAFLTKSENLNQRKNAAQCQATEQLERLRRVCETRQSLEANNALMADVLAQEEACWSAVSKALEGATTYVDTVLYTIISAQNPLLRLPR